jgi:DMSO/TMAO reductase YedYZ molybdopterin-dependent catalytic subunit
LSEHLKFLSGTPASDTFDIGDFDAVDAAKRKPPGQTYAKKFPHLEYARVPSVDSPGDWSLRAFGEVEAPFEVNLIDFMDWPTQRLKQDFHCITGWSLLDTEWVGVPGVELVKRTQPADSVTTVLIHGLDEFSTCMWVEDFMKGVMAWSYQDKPLSLRHGFPIRYIAPPHLWQYKSCKWVTGIEFLTEHKLGFWEIRAYSDSAMVWENDRYANPFAEDGRPLGAIRVEALKRWKEERGS